MKTTTKTSKANKVTPVDMTKEYATYRELTAPKKPSFLDYFKTVGTTRKLG